jgi:hypothetical protein
MAGCASRRGGASKVDTYHVRLPALKHVKYTAEETVSVYEVVRGTVTGSVNQGSWLTEPESERSESANNLREMEYWIIHDKKK